MEIPAAVCRVRPRFPAFAQPARPLAPTARLFAMAIRGQPSKRAMASTTTAGQCAVGTTNCSGGMLSCIPGTPSVEVCDGKDNDCDNVTDENNPGGGQFCTAASAQGECRNGSTSCSGGSIVCVPSGATTEVCDGKDNDCDGAIDENNAEALGARQGCPGFAVLAQ
jgi:hypothetical protein